MASTRQSGETRCTVDVPRLTADRRRTKTLNRGRSRVVARNRRGVRRGRGARRGGAGGGDWSTYVAPDAGGRGMPAGPLGHWEQMGIHPGGIYRVSHLAHAPVQRRNNASGYIFTQFSTSPSFVFISFHRNFCAPFSTRLLSLSFWHFNSRYSFRCTRIRQFFQLLFRNLKFRVVESFIFGF